MKVYRLGDKLLRQCTVSPCTTLIPLELQRCAFHAKAPTHHVNHVELMWLWIVGSPR